MTPGIGPGWQVYIPDTWVLFVLGTQGFSSMQGEGFWCSLVGEETSLVGSSLKNSWQFLIWDLEFRDLERLWMGKSLRTQRVNSSAGKAWKDTGRSHLSVRWSGMVHSCEKVWRLRHCLLDSCGPCSTHKTDGNPRSKCGTGMSYCVVFNLPELWTVCISFWLKKAVLSVGFWKQYRLYYCWQAAGWWSQVLHFTSSIRIFPACICACSRSWLAPSA